MQFSNEGSLRPDGMRAIAIANDNHPSPPKQGHPVLIRATPLNKIRIRSIISCKRTYTYTRMHNSCVVRARMLRRKGLERPTYLYISPTWWAYAIHLANLRGTRTLKVIRCCYFDQYGMHVIYSLNLILQDLSPLALRTTYGLVLTNPLHTFFLSLVNSPFYKFHLNIDI